MDILRNLELPENLILIILGGIISILMALTVPIAFLIIALSLFTYRNNDKVKMISFTVLAIALAIGGGWAFTEIFISFINTFKKVPEEFTVNILSWFTVKPDLYLINKVGRWGATIGGLLGLALPIAYQYNYKSDKSGPGLVRGEKIIKGGWSTLKDIEDKCSFEYPKKGVDIGTPIGKMQGKFISVNPNKGKIKIAGHVLMIGPTGTGKSHAYIRNQIIAAAMAEHSIVITDPKGELFQDMAKWLDQEGYNVIPFNVLEPAHSYWWNMLSECKDVDEIIDLAEWLISSAGEDNHAFFTGGEKSALAAVMGYVKYAIQDEELKHMKTVLTFLSYNQSVLDVMFKTAFTEGRVPQDIYELWLSCQLHYENYREGIRSKLRSITKGGLAALISKSDFNLDMVGREKTALFMIIPAGKSDITALLTPFYTFMFKRLDQLAAEQKNGKLPIPARFIMDEFANIGKVPDIDNVCALGRSKGIMVLIAVQNIGQLKGLYSHENVWETVAENCPTKLCFSAGGRSSADYFSEMIGKAEIEHITASKDLRKIFEPRGKKMTTTTVPLIEPAEILQLPEDDCIAIIRGKKPLYIQKVPWTDMPQYRDIVKAGKVMVKEFVPERSLIIDIPRPPTSDGAGRVPSDIPGSPTGGGTPPEDNISSDFGDR